MDKGTGAETGDGGLTGQPVGDGRIASPTPADSANSGSDDPQPATLTAASAQLGASITPQLTIPLPKECDQYLDAHFDVAVTESGSAARADDYRPTLDGTPVGVPDVVQAVMALTNAGFSAAHGGDTQGPLYRDTLSQVVELVERRFNGLVATRTAAALKLGPTPDSPDLTMVSRADVRAVLTDFLRQVMAAQKSRAVRITEPVRLAVQALTKGLSGPATGIPGSLGGSTPGDPAQLAAHIARQLPDAIPRANMEALQRLSPKEVSAPNQSAADAVAGVLSKEVNAAISLLPKSWQDTVRSGVADALAALSVALVDQAMSDSPLDDKTKKAIHSSVEAAIKQKESGPPMDRKSGTEGRPDAHPQPQPSQPLPDEPDRVHKTPPINLP